MYSNMNKDIVIVDYGMGNIFSLRKVIDRIGFQSRISADPDEVKRAKRIILPGVGHFGKAMSNLRNANLVESLNEAVLVNKTPVLGICLGMQLMARHSEEGDSEGLNWFDANVVKFDIKDKVMFKVPHVGWNTATHEKPGSKLLSGVDMDDEFYFVHSYHVEPSNKNEILSQTPYEVSFVSAIERDNIYGVQFHPEKSHKAGEQMIRNFLND